MTRSTSRRRRVVPVRRVFRAVTVTVMGARV